MLFLSSCVQEGENRLVYLNGNLREVFCAKRLDDGRLVKVGVCSTWFDNGQLHKVESFDEQGLPIGCWQIWDQDGTKMCQGEYKQEKSDLYAVWTFFHHDGSRCRVETYLNGKKHGKWLYWHNDSILCQESQYQDDTPTGVWEYWDNIGRLIKVEEYQHGVKHKEIFYKTTETQ